MDKLDLMIVYNAEEEIQALLYRTMLEEAGIDVVERPMEVPWLEGVRQRALHSQLLVRQEDAERARQLIDAFTAEADRGEHELSDGETPRPQNQSDSAM